MQQRQRMEMLARWEGRIQLQTFAVVLVILYNGARFHPLCQRSSSPQWYREGKDCLSSEHSDTSNSLDLAFSLLGEELCLDNHGLIGQRTIAEHLEESMTTNIDDWDGILGRISLLIMSAGLLAHQTPQTISVDSWAVELLLGLVEITHTNLTEVTRVIFIEVDTMVMLTTSITTTTWMLTVLTNSTVTSADVTSLLTILLQ